MSEFKAPDLSAPRFRPKSTIVLNKKLHKAFIEKYPMYKDISLNTFKEIVNTYNGKIYEGAINHRDGVELPESLGYVIVTRCNRPQVENIDFNSSVKYGKKVKHKNWDSDDYLAKICYTNYSLKYRFSDRELWGFTASRQFKNAVSNSFAEMYNTYIHLTKNVKLATLYKNR